jgi:carbonic anhydrase/acetyltransferase-like protein (isoleucine patch superfamily)
MGIDTKITSNAFIADNATILGDVEIGSQASIWFGVVLRADKDRITIGNRSNIQDNTDIHTSAGYPVMVGDDVSVGHGAILHGCKISNEVLVGMGAIIMNGAVIGEGSVIGAGCVITEGKVIPPGSVVLGVPGKVVRKTDETQLAHIRDNAMNYIELSGRYRHG